MTDKTLVMDSGLFLHHFVFFSSRAIYSEVDTFCFFFFFGVHPKLAILI
jgi:hypothetical protein